MALKCYLASDFFWTKLWTTNLWTAFIFLWQFLDIPVGFLFLREPIYIYILKNLGKSGGFEMKPNKLVNLSVKDLAFWG